KVAERQIVELQRQVETRAVHAQLVPEAEARVDQLTRAVAEAEAGLAALAERVQALESRKPLRDELRTRLRSLKTESDDLAKEVIGLRGALAEAEQVLAQRDAIEAGVASLRAAQAELERQDGLRGSYDALHERRRGHEEAQRDAERRLRADLRIAEGELKGLRERAGRRPALEAEIARLTAQLDG